MVIDTDQIFPALISKTSTVTVHWKTTANGLLSAATMVVLAWMTLPPTASKLVYAAAALRALVGFMQKDAGKALAVPSGESAAVPVPSHEVPDDPSAIPIAEAK